MLRDAWEKACTIVGLGQFICRNGDHEIRGWGTRSGFQRYAIVSRRDVVEEMRKLQITLVACRRVSITSPAYI
jgi:hypothetical protein